MKDKRKIICKRMNRLIHSIHKKSVIIYQNNQQYYSIDQDVYVYRGVFNFNYCYKDNRMVIFIANDYINYILKTFRKYHIHYCIIQINYGYHQVLWYQFLNSFYDKYYKKGRRIVKNERMIEKVIKILYERKDMNLLMKVDKYLDGYN